MRKEPKGHGTDKLIDGQYRDGGKTILFEDVTTTDGSVMKALAKEGIELVSVFTKDDFAD